MLRVVQTDGEIGDALAAGLERVQQCFSDELQSDLDCVNELAKHVERYRGKMLRPTLLLVSAMAYRSSTDLGELQDDAVIAAAVCEMVHMATLVHDDILDEADIRRRGATINHLRGNESAVMLGDYLISHAYHLCTSLGRADISRAVAKATNTLCEGELLQLSHRDDWSLDEATYYEIIRRKTAALVGLCCELPTRLAHPPEQRNGDARIGEALFSYGEKLGIAFQIIDDLLDLAGDEATVGKSLGRDLAKGKLTLPLILYLAQEEDQGAAAMRRLLDAAAQQRDNPQVSACREILERLQESACITKARQHAQDLVAQAKATLEATLEDSAAKAMMLDMANAVVDRNF